MKLYLDKNLESIPVLNQLVTLLAEFYVSNLPTKLDNINDITELKHLYDPVRDFIEYYGTGANIELSKDRIDYIVNSLYMSKGSQRVFEMIEELLEVRIEYTYDFPIIEVIQFHNLKLTNVPQFVNKISTALYYLVYYTELTIKFRQLVLSLQGNLTSYFTSTVFDYKIYNVVDSHNIIDDEFNVI